MQMIKSLLWWKCFYQKEKICIYQFTEAIPICRPGSCLSAEWFPLTSEGCSTEETIKVQSLDTGVLRAVLKSLWFLPLHCSKVTHLAALGLVFWLEQQKGGLFHARSDTDPVYCTSQNSYSSMSKNGKQRVRSTWCSMGQGRKRVVVIKKRDKKSLNWLSC